MFYLRFMFNVMYLKPNYDVVLNLVKVYVLFKIYVYDVVLNLVVPCARRSPNQSHFTMKIT